MVVLTGCIKKKDAYVTDYIEKDYEQPQMQFDLYASKLCLIPAKEDEGKNLIDQHLSIR